MDLDAREKEGKFKLFYVKLDYLETLLTNSLNDNPVNPGIVKEMITAYNCYKEGEEII